CASLAILIPAILFLVGWQSVLNAATVFTDQEIYFFPDTVFITGTGFAKDEVVTLQVVHSDGFTGDASTAAHQPWTVTADATGGFDATWDLCAYSAYSTFQLTASGPSSGTVTAVFSDPPGPPNSPNKPAATACGGKVILTWSK